MPAFHETRSGRPVYGQIDAETANGGLFRLNDAVLGVCKSIELEQALQAVADGARYITNARYGVVALTDEFGDFQQLFTSGVTAEQLRRMTTPPVGRGLLGYLNEIDAPLRVANIAEHPRSVGTPNDHPPITCFLGVRVLYEGEHLANIYLAEKVGASEFSELDEELIVQFAEHAGAAIVNARRFERERAIKTDLKALVKIAPVGLVVFDAKTGVILASNQECLRIAGQAGSEAFSWEEILGKMTMRRADGREIKVGDRPSSQVMRSGEVVRGEEILLCFNDGRQVRTLVNAAPIYSDRGEITSVVVAVQDLTPLQDAGRMRAELLGMVSQELRTPLTTIKGSTVALSDMLGPSTANETQKWLQIIDHQTELMRDRINSLIDLGQIAAGTLSLSLESADTCDLVSQAAREFRINHSGISIERKVPENLPAISVDKGRFSQMLRDLFSHAFKFASETSTISLNAETVGPLVRFTLVAGSGRAGGYQAPELFQKIAESYSVKDTPDIDGDGLALTVCKGIAEAHGGQLTAEPGPTGQGMVFTFTIPIASDAQPEQTQEPHSADGTETGLDSGVATVVVAWNDESTAANILETLDDAGYQPIVVNDLFDIEFLIAEHRPQSVLLDLSSAGRDGFETLGRIVAGQNVSTIAVVDQGDGARAARATAMGVDWCVVKPISPTELIGRLRTPLRRVVGNPSSLPAADYAIGPVSITYDSHRVTVGGEPVQLTATEFKLLYELSNNAGRVLTQAELLKRVWGSEYTGEMQLLRAYVKTLRQKLGDNARSPTYIYTEHGVGYRMAKQ